MYKDKDKLLNLFYAVDYLPNDEKYNPYILSATYARVKRWNKTKLSDIRLKKLNKLYKELKRQEFIYNYNLEKRKKEQGA